MKLFKIIPDFLDWIDSEIPTTDVKIIGMIVIFVMFGCTMFWIWTL